MVRQHKKTTHVSMYFVINFPFSEVFVAKVHFFIGKTLPLQPKINLSCQIHTETYEKDITTFGF